MADLISRKALVTKLSQGYWNRELQQAKNDPCVIDAMIDWAIRIVKEMPLESPWHTGTPTEYGWYLVAYRKRDCDGSFYWDYGTRVWEDYGEYGHWNITSMKYPVIKWQKIKELVEED